MRIEGASLLITGGSSGLGAACVQRFAAAGAHVVIADLKPPADALPHDLAERVSFQATDVTSTDSVEAAINLAASRGNGLRGVIQCAGILGASRILGREAPHDLDLFTRIITVNLVGTFNVMRLAAAAMVDSEPQEEGERGVIINTSSVAAFEGQVGQVAYAASKGGVASICLPAAREFARFGIRVMSIAPGVFMTPMMAAAPDAVVDSLVAQSVFPRRLGEPTEYAATAQHIFENRMLNGSVIRLDGAMRMAAK